MPKPKIPESAPLNSNISLKEKYLALIALPSFNESETLPEVITSLGKNSVQLTDQTLIIININNRSDTDNFDNLKTLSYFKELNTHLHIAWLNNTSPPFSYPDKFGVGLARNQAIAAGLEYINGDAPIISLDGDSPVSENYLEEILKYSKKQSFQAGHVNFSHRLTGSKEEQQAIKMYDKHLHLHRQRLEDSSSPHAWYAIGSTIVCKKNAYIKAGGYNVRRMAGEDFYLLQQLSKTGCSIEMIKDAYVYPSNRPSDRVPFGTGKAVSDILKCGEWHTYNSQCYNELRTLLKAVSKNLQNDADSVTSSLSKEVNEYLEQRNFSSVWGKFQSNCKDEKMVLQRFHEWLDAFQTLKLIHYLSEYYPRENITIP